LYFPEAWNDEQVKSYYNSLLVEQDIDSPHRYAAPGYEVREGDVIADIGAAEGIWALDNVEKAKKMFLFECEPGWMRALEKTFESWDHVFIVNLYVSDVTEGINTTLDDFLEDEELNFIKADIEGAELQLLHGATRTLSTVNNLRLLLCTYHKQNDAAEFKAILEGLGFCVEFSKRYMFFIFDPALSEPYIRRGLIRATKAASPTSCS
jgi:hypothetical protein